MLTYIYMQATPKAIKKPIHEADSRSRFTKPIHKADSESRVKVNKYIDNRLSYSCSYVYGGSEGGEGDGDGNAMFFGHVLFSESSCVQSYMCS